MISILVTVYNVEDYLPRCLDSVIKQSYKDLEIIIVEDGSTDGSGEICDNYVKWDDRIRVIHLKNGGVHTARNVGLRAVSGEYILMIDGDDALHPLMIETLYYLITNGDYDFSMCYGAKVHDVSRIDEMNNVIIDLSTSIDLTQDSCMKNLYIVNDKTVWYQVVWNKLYKKDLICSLFFRETRSEDTDFNNRVYLQMREAVLLPQSLYYWIQRPTSLTHQSFAKRLEDIILSYNLCLDEIPEDNINYRAWCLMRMYKYMPQIRYWTKDTINEKRANYNCSYVRKKTIREFVMNKKIPLIKKCKLLMFNYFQWLYNRMVDIGEWLVKIKPSIMGH